MTSWYEQISLAMAPHDDTWSNVVSHTMSEGQLHAQFNDGYGGPEGCAFTLWTKKRVYFPVMYDGAEWVSSVPRSPCKEATQHIGGG